MLRIAFPLILLSTAPGHADDASQGLRAYPGAGRMLSLEQVLSTVDAEYGKLIDAEIEGEGGRTVYELKMMTPDGRLTEIEVDALTGAILEVEDEHGARDRKGHD